MKVYYKTYYLCVNSGTNTRIGVFGEEVNVLVNSYTFNGLLLPDGTYTITSWFFDLNNFPLGSCEWVFSPLANDLTAGTTYNFSFTASNKDGTTTEYIIQIVAVANCVEAFSNAGCNNVKVLAWLTREGGYAYFAFTGKTTFEVRIPDGLTYKNSDYIIRHNSRPDVYRGELLTTGSIEERALDLLESLKYSVQAYLVEDYATIPRYVPILIQDGDFTKRKTGEKRFDVSVRFIYAEQVQIQSQ